MKQLTWEQLLAVAELWRNGNNRCFGVLCSTRQFLFVIANVNELTIDQVVISVQQVVQRLKIAPERQFTDVTITRPNLLAAWHSTTFEQPKGFVTETFDEVLQLFIRGDVTSATVYRASQFHQKERAG